VRIATAEAERSPAASRTGCPGDVRQALNFEPQVRRVGELGVVGYDGAMSTHDNELSVSQARDRFSDAVNRAAFGGEITYVTRGRGHQRAAAIVPAALVERYEEMMDREDGRIAAERLADLEAGREKALSADEVTRTLEQ
jgi:antitoxin (DNA-binding transcriptional repressor) of toxin-antitoxin stability system